MRNESAGAVLRALHFALIIWSPICCASVVNDYPDLIMHGSSYKNACVDAERQGLFELLRKDIGDAADVYKAVEIMLCGNPDLEARRYLQKIMAKSLLITVESTATSPTTVSRKLDEKDVEKLFANGDAWGVSIGKESSNLVLHYFSDEACIKKIVFKKNKSKWMIYEVGEACD